MTGTVHTLHGLASSELTFTVIALDAAGNKSEMSAPIKTVPAIKVNRKLAYANFKLLTLCTGLAPATVRDQAVVPYKPILEQIDCFLALLSKLC